MCECAFALFTVNSLSTVTPYSRGTKLPNKRDYQHKETDMLVFGPLWWVNEVSVTLVQRSYKGHFVDSD